MNAVSIPESPEVLSQASKEVVGLYRMFVTTKDDRHRIAVRRQVEALVADPARATRIAYLWAEQVADPIRHRFDLSNPDAGVYLAPADPETPLEDGEHFAGLFVTAVLRHDQLTSEAVLEELDEMGPVQQQIFLGLLLAMAANS